MGFEYWTQEYLGLSTGVLYPKNRFTDLCKIKEYANKLGIKLEWELDQ
jgi:hypothetical protein